MAFSIDLIFFFFKQTRPWMDWNKIFKKPCCDFIFEFHSNIKACDVSSLGVPLNMLIIGYLIRYLGYLTLNRQFSWVSDTKQTILMALLYHLGTWHLTNNSHRIALCSRTTRYASPPRELTKRMEQVSFFLIWFDFPLTNPPHYSATVLHYLCDLQGHYTNCDWMVDMVLGSFKR